MQRLQRRVFCLRAGADVCHAVADLVAGDRVADGRDAPFSFAAQSVWEGWDTVETVAEVLGGVKWSVYEVGMPGGEGRRQTMSIKLIPAYSFLISNSVGLISGTGASFLSCSTSTPPYASIWTAVWVLGMAEDMVLWLLGVLGVRMEVMRGLRGGSGVDMHSGRESKTRRAMRRDISISDFQAGNGGIAGIFVSLYS